jgi:hypothetical protein
MDLSRFERRRLAEHSHVAQGLQRCAESIREHRCHSIPQGHQLLRQVCHPSHELRHILRGSVDMLSSVIETPPNSERISRTLFVDNQ